MKFSPRAAFLVGALLLISNDAWAHVVVTPKKVGLASWVTFNVSVPNEKETANTQLKLLVPEGVDSISPTVKPGWKITIEKDGKGKATAIVWTGNLPSEFRDDFSFSAQVSDKPVALNWKAYQTYQGGMIVSWDVDPTSPDAKDPEALEKTGRGPYSITQVIDDLTSVAMTPQVPAPVSATDSPLTSVALLVAVVALIVALVALFRRKKNA